VGDIPIEVKLAIVYTVSKLKTSTDALHMRLQYLVEQARTAKFKPSPLNNFAANFIIEASEGEHGKMIRDAQHKLNNMFEKLKDCGGDSATVLSVADELEELNPILAKIDESFEELYQTMSNKKREYVEMN